MMTDFVTTVDADGGTSERNVDACAGPVQGFSDSRLRFSRDHGETPFSAMSPSGEFGEIEMALAPRERLAWIPSLPGQKPSDVA